MYQLRNQKALTLIFTASYAGRGYDVSYETPRSEGLSLFHLGERKYDHLLFLPSKVKGMFSASQYLYLRGCIQCFYEHVPMAG